MSRPKGITAKATTPETGGIRATYGDAFADASKEDQGLAAVLDELVSGGDFDRLVEQSLGALEAATQAELSAENARNPTPPMPEQGSKELEPWIHRTARKYGLARKIIEIRVLKAILARVADVARTGSVEPANALLKAVAAMGEFRATRKAKDPWQFYLLALAGSPPTPGNPRMIQGTKTQILKRVLVEMKRDGVEATPTLSTVADKLRQYGYTCLKSNRGGRRPGAGRRPG